MATEKEEMTGDRRRKISPLAGLIPAFAGMFIGAISLVAAFTQMQSNQAYNKLSVRPQVYLKLDWWGSYPGDKETWFKMNMRNVGLGPAELTEWSICLNREPRKSITSVGQLGRELKKDLLKVGCTSIPSYKSFNFNLHTSYQ